MDSDTLTRAAAFIDAAAAHADATFVGHARIDILHLVRLAWAAVGLVGRENQEALPSPWWALGDDLEWGRKWRWFTCVGCMRGAETEQAIDHAIDCPALEIDAAIRSMAAEVDA